MWLIVSECLKKLRRISWPIGKSEKNKRACNMVKSFSENALHVKVSKH